jgi:hypothetical protein
MLAPYITGQYRDELEKYVGVRSELGGVPSCGSASACG